MILLERQGVAGGAAAAGADDEAGGEHVAELALGRGVGDAGEDLVVDALERGGDAEVQEEGGAALGQAAREVGEGHGRLERVQARRRACSRAMRARVRRASRICAGGAPAPTSLCSWMRTSWSSSSSDKGAKSPPSGSSKNRWVGQ